MGKATRTLNTQSLKNRCWAAATTKKKKKRGGRRRRKKEVPLVSPETSRPQLRDWRNIKPLLLLPLLFCCGRRKRKRRRRGGTTRPAYLLVCLKPNLSSSLLHVTLLSTLRQIVIRDQSHLVRYSISSPLLLLLVFCP